MRINPDHLLLRVAPMLLAILATATAAVAVIQAQTGLDCQERLATSAPLTSNQRDFLETCVGAFSLPTATPAGPSPTGTSPSTTAPATTAPPSSSTTTTRPPTPAPELEFPTPATTGVPAGWTPTQTRTSTLRVTQAGTVVQDLRIINASLLIEADNVTVRRVQIEGGRIDNRPGSRCSQGLVLEDVSMVRATGPTTGSEPAIGTGGYTARRVEINGLPEGFRVGGKVTCGPTLIEDSFALARAPDSCDDWHGDALQGYDGGALTIRHSTLDLVERSGCGGTAPFFFPRGDNQANRGPVTVDRLLVKGGGFTFRLGMPGSVVGLRIVAGSSYGPIDVRCSVVNPWEAQVVTVDSGYRILTRRTQTCNTESGF